jgi:hypothetical protein
MMMKMPQSISDFDDYLNSPQFGFGSEEPMEVRQYRHDAYKKWDKALNDIILLVVEVRALRKHEYICSSGKDKKDGDL